MRYYGKSQANQDKVLDNYCHHVISALRALRSKGHVIIIVSSFNTNSTKYGLIERKWKLGEKSPNPIRKTEKDNQRTNKNILVL